jgi:NAD(P)-dependent dehydrogenase (short-subunit alcohol dehydrogenase family)
MSYSAQSILISGCSSGIGLCAAKMLKNRGYRVFATARNPSDVERLNSQGLESLSMDLDDSASINAAVDELLSRTDGKLYALFNNGAYGQPGAVEDLSRKVLRAQLETNLLGWLELTNRIIPVMRSQGYGRIIQNSSVLGLVALPFRGAYICSKYALEGLTDSLRLELKGSGVYISLIEPGPIESRFRVNALLALQSNIDTQSSVHKEKYQGAIRRLKQQGPTAPFTLPADAVVKKLIKALESPRPKPRYYVTLPTYFLSLLRRCLSTRQLDRVLLSISRKENR